eukprot:CAMPEP_0178415920 /NCGR_PEP_ID=MMETSP0689_2-20121128/23797_1 /TAXON_ID=160604 /ORGANISM="Amphidinium massartii, Strain CS-259" /LENGTH=585 /DNA_ID=CAMNT_0020037249 /DNA_START=1 /DNA_END=1758 /DNA_ORIENTATION=-
METEAPVFGRRAKRQQEKASSSNAATAISQSEEGTVQSSPPVFDKKAHEQQQDGGMGATSAQSHPAEDQAATPSEDFSTTSSGPPLFGKKAKQIEEKQRSKTPPTPPVTDQEKGGIEAPPLFGKKAQQVEARKRLRTPPEQDVTQVSLEEANQRAVTLPADHAERPRSQTGSQEEAGSPSSRLKKSQSVLSTDNEGSPQGKGRTGHRVSFMAPADGSGLIAGNSGEDDELLAQSTRSLGAYSSAEAVLAAALEADGEGESAVERSDTVQIPEDDGTSEAANEGDLPHEDSFPWYLQPPRMRSLEAEQRYRDRCRMLRAVEGRPDFGSKSTPSGRPGWNSRHQLIYENAKLNPNYRCYFDRWKDFRDPAAPPSGRIAPSWKLFPEGESIEEREEGRRIFTLWSTSRPVDREGAFPVKSSSTSQLSRRSVSKQEYSSVTTWRTATTQTWRAEVSLDSKASMKAASFWDATSQCDRKGTTEAKKKSWDDRHHVMWSNEQHLSHRKLISMPQRAYFDRPRVPYFGGEKEQKEKDHHLPILWKLKQGPSKFHPTLSSPSFFQSPDAGGFRPTEAKSPRERAWDTRHYITK